jgi:hypothetical protein
MIKNINIIPAYRTTEHKNKKQQMQFQVPTISRRDYSPPKKQEKPDKARYLQTLKNTSKGRPKPLTQLLGLCASTVQT